MRRLAALNHPRIAQIHRLEESGGTRALVMELVEGEDLSSLIARGPIPLDEALPIARQVAEALEAAHNAGVVHRDLKPANIKLRADGTIKILDFGLAKSVVPDAHGHIANSPTITSPVSTPGMVLGTAAYMAPEQARGKPVDKRADIWAFGCVLFEMLTGRGPFSGESVTDTLARIIEREPDWKALPVSTPPHVVAVLERCFRKDPARRIHDIADARIQLDDGAEAARDLRPAAPPRRRTGLAVVVAAALAAGVALGWTARRPTSSAPGTSTPVQLDFLLPSGFELFTTALTQLTISPDGSRVAFVAGGAGVRELFVRPLDKRPRHL